MNSKKRTFLSIGIIALGVTFCVLGAYRGEIAVMFEKAVNICLECIGIG